MPIAVSVDKELKDTTSLFSWKLPFIGDLPFKISAPHAIKELFTVALVEKRA